VGGNEMAGRIRIQFWRDVIEDIYQVTKTVKSFF
jgi:hypothetical protein